MQTSTLFASLFFLGGLGVGAFLLIALIALAIFIFEIWMFVDLIQNARIPTEQKVLWAVGMLLVHPFVAIAYYIYSRYQLK